MDTYKVIEEQIEILSKLSRGIASGEIKSEDGQDYLPLLPDIGTAIAALYEAGKE